MKVSLSSSLTFVYKIVIPTIWTICILTVSLIVCVLDESPAGLIFSIGTLPMVMFIKLQQVTYDEHQVYVSNFRSSWTYQLRDIKALNEGTMPLDPLFELEIFETNGQIRKVDFMQKVQEHLNYMATERLTGRLLEFKKKIRDAKTTTE